MAVLRPVRVALRVPTRSLKEVLFDPLHRLNSLDPSSPTCPGFRNCGVFELTVDSRLHCVRDERACDVDAGLQPAETRISVLTDVTDVTEVVRC